MQVKGRLWIGHPVRKRWGRTRLGIGGMERMESNEGDRIRPAQVASRGSSGRGNE